MKYLSILFAALVLVNCSSESKKDSYDPAADTLRYEQEVHFKNVRQLTFGANNAEA